MNGYPGPLHVLEFADELELSDFQRESVERMFSEMRDESRALGRDIVAREAELNALFAEKRADEARLRETTREIARLKGELRIAHLKWHLKTPAAFDCGAGGRAMMSCGVIIPATITRIKGRFAELRKRWPRALASRRGS